jgi:hypothetical protein
VIPQIHIDFKQKLSELSTAQLQSLTEEDIKAYALTIPQLTLLNTNRDMLLKECADLASTNNTDANLNIRDRILEERTTALAETEQWSKLAKEFTDNLTVLKPLTRVNDMQSVETYLGELEAELKRLNSEQETITAHLQGDLAPEQVRAFLDLRTRIRELEALQKLLLT